MYNDASHATRSAKRTAIIAAAQASLTEASEGFTLDALNPASINVRLNKLLIRVEFDSGSGWHGYFPTKVKVKYMTVGGRRGGARNKTRCFALAKDGSFDAKKIRKVLLEGFAAEEELNACFEAQRHHEERIAAKRIDARRKLEDLKITPGIEGVSCNLDYDCAKITITGDADALRAVIDKLNS